MLVVLVAENADGVGDILSLFLGFMSGLIGE